MVSVTGAHDMKKLKFTYLVSLLAVFYWLMESVIHRYLFHEMSFELMPSNTNEMWMRSFSFALLIFLGVYADKQTKKIAAKEQQKHEVYLATVSSAQHILNNLLNQMQLALYDQGKRGGLDSETKELLKRSLQESKEQVVRLSSVTDLDHDAIRQSVAP
jgi:ABC-type nickel/cobalt efflux system permease component RcnA